MWSKQTCFKTVKMNEKKNAKKLPKLVKSIPKRGRAGPSWFGNMAKSTDLNFSDELEDPYADDSFNDKTYVPETKKVPNLPKAKRTKTMATIPKEHSCNEFMNLELDDEFDKITNSKLHETACIKSTAVHELHDMSASHLVDVNESHSPTKNRLNSGLVEGEANVISKTSSIDINLLMSLHQNSIEILARISVIEESLIKNKILTTIKKEDKFEEITHANVFLKANNFPFNCMEHMNTFEANLDCEDFKKVAVSDIF